MKGEESAERRWKRLVERAKPAVKQDLVERQVRIVEASLLLVALSLPFSLSLS